MTRNVVPGVSVLATNPDLVGPGQFGLLTNFTGTTESLQRNVDVLLESGLNLRALFGPEHGMRGSAQAGETEGEGRDASTGLPVYETYMASAQELDELILGSGVDAVIFDMQDIGVRYYTYIWTMYDAMLSAARTGRRFVVLDRPNPLGGSLTSGPGLDERVASFVGRVDIPQRHGLTAGELARLFNQEFLPSAVGHEVDLQVVTMANWTRDTEYSATGLAWVPPSPNMPTVDSAFAFAGTGLFEGTNVSEGRGTTKPFELVGAPYVDARLLTALRELEIPGALFREAWFTPSFHKYANQTIPGVQLHVTDRELFEPVGCGVSMISAFARLYPDDFSFSAPGERVDLPQRGHAVDRLWGSSSLRDVVEAGEDPGYLVPAPLATTERYPDGVLLYE